jgi:hypothetical protein
MNLKKENFGTKYRDPKMTGYLHKYVNNCLLNTYTQESLQLTYLEGKIRILNRSEKLTSYLNKICSNSKMNLV